MSPILIDTNVLVYTFDQNDPQRQERAIEILRALEAGAEGRLSVQCLAEFCAVAETPAPHPLEEEEHDHGPGFEALLGEGYARYQCGEVSFGRLAEELGVTTWELSRLLEERGWPASNLPSLP